MFLWAELFNQDVGDWDLSLVTDTSYMFSDAFLFNQDLNDWDVSQVTYTESMFESATSFNGNISNWNTGNIDEMWGMFLGATSFNQDISGWDTSQVAVMTYLFAGATSFNQDLSSWNISHLYRADGIFDDSALTPLNYSKVLRSWATQPHLDENPNSHGPIYMRNGPQYFETVEANRQALIDDNWVITDDSSITALTPIVLGPPNASSISVGQSLSHSVLSGGAGSVAGTFAFTSPSTVPGLGNNSVSVNFTPANDIEYTPVVLAVSVEVTSNSTPAPSPTGASVQAHSLVNTGAPQFGPGLILGLLLLGIGGALLGLKRGRRFR